MQLSRLPIATQFRGSVKCGYRFIHSKLPHRLESTLSSTEPKWTSKTIRHTFLNFFEDRHHEVTPSSSVLASRNDDSYFVNAGMNQFKSIFLGTVEPDSKLGQLRRCTSSQKCVRVGGKHNDLSDVGRDLYHHTFFEMLGNWSFGDYFKEEACEMAWELLTHKFGLHPESLCVTYFNGDSSLGLPPDNETKEIWRKIGVSENRILPFGMRDNFWDMGRSGPCGPCTEIHYISKGVKDFPQLVNQGSPLVIEIWNLVFMQFNRLHSGLLERLPQQHVDTGMGLERISAVLNNGSCDNYSTDLFFPIFQRIWQECGTFKYGESEAVDYAYRKIADHIRMVAVCIADGVGPSKILSGAKVRQVLRQSLLCQQTILSAPPSLNRSLLQPVLDSLGSAYPELLENQSHIEEVLDNEELLYFGHMKDVQHIVRQVKDQLGSQRQIKGAMLQDVESNKLGHLTSWDCFENVADLIGLEIIEETSDDTEPVKTMAQKNSDVGFAACFDMVEEFKFTDNSSKYDCTPSDNAEFPYEFSTLSSQIEGVIVNGKLIDNAKEGDTCYVILQSSNFYPEGGGQMADAGTISTGSGLLTVLDVQIHKGRVFHKCLVEEGSICQGDTASLTVDERKRNKVTRAHSGTHILNYVIRQLFGPGAIQTSSSVQEDRLTFAFKHKDRLLMSQLETLEKETKKIISEDLPIQISYQDFSDIKKNRDAIFLPGTSYPQRVRVMGFPVSEKADFHHQELCGGCHVDSTGLVQDFIIINTGKASGESQSIVAFTGEKAIKAHGTINQMEGKYNQLLSWVESGTHKELWPITLKELNIMLHTSESMPRPLKEKMRANIDKRIKTKVNVVANQLVEANNLEILRSTVEQPAPVIFKRLKFKASKDMIRCVGKLNASKPIILLAKTRDGISVVLSSPNPVEQELLNSVTSTLLSVVDQQQMNTETIQSDGLTLTLFSFPSSSKVDDLEKAILTYLGDTHVNVTASC